MFGLYSLLGAMGMPTFYDKLLCVPLLNLARAGDRSLSCRSIGQRPILQRAALDGPLGRGNLAHMAVWVAFFGLMTTTGAADGMHTGDSLPFWEQACAEKRAAGRASGCCASKPRIAATTPAGPATSWAAITLEGRIVDRDPDRAFAYFSRACEGRFQAGCVNLLDASTPSRANPRPLDLRLLLREGGPNLLEMPEPELYQRACRHGWAFACQRAAN